jgi:hypothetical protein
MLSFGAIVLPKYWLFAEELQPAMDSTNPITRKAAIKIEKVDLIRTPKIQIS